MLDPHSPGAISTRAWPRLLKYVEEITSGERTLNLTPELMRRCRSLLAKIWPMRKQLGIDGLKNMWILKPPSSSRGRGIAISQVGHSYLQQVCNRVYATTIKQTPGATRKNNHSHNQDNSHNQKKTTTNKTRPDTRHKMRLVRV